MPSSSPQSKRSLDEIAASLLAKRGLELVSCTPIQSLWAGYGHICRVSARFPKKEEEEEEEEKQTLSLILKYISPPSATTKKKKRRSQVDEGHLRKMLSYQVEQHFYAHLAPRLLQLRRSSPGGGEEDGDRDGEGDEVAVAECLASVHDGTTTALLLRDLQREVPTIYHSCFSNQEEEAQAKVMMTTTTVATSASAFPLALEKRGTLTPDLVDAALDWLAGFHGFFWRDEEKSRYAAGPEQQQQQHLVPPPLEFAASQQQQQQQSTATTTDSATTVAAGVVHGVWQNGGYTYLATRRSEYAALEADDDSEWSAALCQKSPGSSSSSSSSVAEQVAYYLSPAHPATAAYATLIHGDVKSENMFGRSGGSSSSPLSSSSSSSSSPNSTTTTTTKKSRVAFFDFQYVGLGLGVCDLAKLFTCSVPVSSLVSSYSSSKMMISMQPGEKTLLQRYLARLEAVSGKPYPWDVFVGHWEAALVDWLRFQASWGFWGNTDWLEARVREILSRKKNKVDDDDYWRH